MEIRNAEEIYIHYFADKCRGVTDGAGVQEECKPMVFSLTQIEVAEHFCQEEEHFVSGQKCDQQNEKLSRKIGAHLASSPTSLGSDVNLLGKPIDNSRLPSQVVFKGVNGGNENRREQNNATAALDLERMEGNESEKTEVGKKRKEKVRKKERMKEDKVAEKSKVESGELESFLEEVPKRRKDATTQVEKGLMRRLLGRKPIKPNYLLNIFIIGKIGSKIPYLGHSGEKKCIPMSGEISLD